MRTTLVAPKKLSLGSREEWTQYGLSLLIGLVTVAWAIVGDRYVSAGSFGGVLLLTFATVKFVNASGRDRREANLRFRGFLVALLIFVAVMAGRQDVELRLPFLAWHLLGLTAIPGLGWLLFTIEARRIAAAAMPS